MRCHLQRLPQCCFLPLLLFESQQEEAELPRGGALITDKGCSSNWLSAAAELRLRGLSRVASDWCRIDLAVCLPVSLGPSPLPAPLPFSAFHQPSLSSPPFHSANHSFPASPSSTAAAALSRRGSSAVSTGGDQSRACETGG